MNQALKESWPRALRVALANYQVWLRALFDDIFCHYSYDSEALSHTTITRLSRAASTTSMCRTETHLYIQARGWHDIVIDVT
jgi:hypothetical protein